MYKIPILDNDREGERERERDRHVKSWDQKNGQARESNLRRIFSTAIRVGFH